MKITVYYDKCEKLTRAPFFEEIRSIGEYMVTGEAHEFIGIVGGVIFFPDLGKKILVSDKDIVISDIEKVDMNRMPCETGE